MKSIIRTFSLVLALFSVVNANAQLSDKEFKTLKSKVRTDAKLDGITDGARIYKTSRHWTLVSFATVSSNFKPAQQNRQAQLLASRNAIEWLKGTQNASISVYDAYSNDSHDITEQQGSDVTQENQSIASATSINVRENSQLVEKVTFSDNIVQDARENIDGLQPLFKYNGDDGICYVYFMVISKQLAKKKR